MEQFKYGDKVTHQLHGEGKVHNTYPDENLVQVFFKSNPSLQALVHPVSLTKVAVPKFEARIVWKGGVVTHAGQMDKQALRQYLSRLDEERMDSYTVTRIKSKDERVADYFASMAAEDDADTKSS